MDFRSNSVYKQLHVQDGIERLTEKRERHTHTHAHTHTHTHMYAHTREFSYAHTHMNSHMHTHTHYSKGIKVAIITKEFLGVMLTAPVSRRGPTAA